MIKLAPLACLLLAACDRPASTAAVAPAPAPSSQASSPAPPPQPSYTPSPTPSPAPSPANAAADLALAVDGEGLRLFDPASGSARALPFGTPRARVLAALAFRGPPGLGVNRECGAGPLGYANWPDGLSLRFQDDEFVGWGLDGRAAGAIATAAGIGPGSTRAQPPFVLSSH